MYTDPIVIADDVMTVPRNMSSAKCLRRLPYKWRHLRQRNSVNKIETYVTRQQGS